MKLKRIAVGHGTLERYGDCIQYAEANFMESTLITQQDLKQRAQSMAFSKYKQIKREVHKKEAQRRLNWFLSIVKAKKVATVWLARARAHLNLKYERD